MKKLDSNSNNSSKAGPKMSNTGRKYDKELNKDENRKITTAKFKCTCEHILDQAFKCNLT